ncbi:Breast cancer anti-estrogen resistance protein 3 [Acipenser ruthenus]|uniref:Breast cancer anti-estrogen resistance protein 3 n=1 Tax=Acipenser ruthenus TaxID=7906 RepID=A0A662YJL3_ACIRT|nr:Breast cancer anti-estrogen resistance protein 3 [Acipenser ruthenus]
MMGVTKEQRQLMGVGSGLELLTLPHGHQLRLDLLERHHLIALGIAVDVLGCTGTVSQRASVLNKVIQLSAELKNTAGDLYAFSAVMKALEMPQIASLEMTWRALRRNHTESAIAFEKQLKPFYKALNQGKDETPVSRTAVPHILPLVKLMEGVGLGEDTEEGCEQLLKTLGAARAITLNAGLYSSYASSLLKDFKPKEELLEVFKTEFALRLFWGSKGAEAKQEERYQKFDKILSVLAGKLETGAASEL